MRSRRSSDGWNHGRRALVGAFLVAATLVLSGCAAVDGPDTSPIPETTEPAATASPTETTAEPTAAASPTGTTTENTSGHDHGDGHAHGDHDRGTDGGTETEQGATTETPSDATATGEMTVVVAGTELAPATGATAEEQFWFDEDEPHTWHGTGETTVADALEAFDANATDDSLTYNGTTYRDDEDGVSVNVRLNGEEVDPTAHTLGDGDEVWVTVETPDMNVSTPGEYIRHDVQHVHGPMTFVVNGTEVDFSQDRFQSGHRHFHFEGGHADPWHAHSYSVTLGYALSTLPGIDATADTVTYNGTTYRDGENTTVTVEVNGEPVVPSEYYLKDGDAIHIEVATDS